MPDHDLPCDLHLHSSYSDGRMSPDELVQYARMIGLAAVSVTDHDTLLGQEEALAAGVRHGIEVVTGVEFAVNEGGANLHILGYCFDHRNAGLTEALRALAEARLGRARAIVEKLAEAGVVITFDEVLEAAGRGAVGRPHVAHVLHRRSLVPSISEAFNRYLADGACCDVPKTVLSLDEVVRLVRASSGVAVWAHPGYLIRRAELVERVVAAGIGGIEAWHPNHSETQVREIVAVAAARRLVCTGGSDFHSPDVMQADIGEVAAPFESVVALRAAASRGDN